MEFDLKGSGFNVFMRRWATGVSFWFLGGRYEHQRVTDGWRSCRSRSTLLLREEPFSIWIDRHKTRPCQLFCTFPNYHAITITELYHQNRSLPLYVS